MAGMSMKLVSSDRPRMSRFNSKAMPSPNNSCRVMAGPMIAAVLTNERQKRWSSVKIST
jgi:hypothetical protein